jgi:hypothetical protein
VEEETAEREMTFGMTVPGFEEKEASLPCPRDASLSDAVPLVLSYCITTIFVYPNTLLMAEKSDATVRLRRAVRG